MPHISIAAEPLTHIAGIPITNSLVTTWLVMILLTLFARLATRNLTMVPGNLQSIAEIAVGGLYSLFSSITGKYIKQVYPLLLSIFMYIILANWVGLLPGVGTIGFFKTETAEAKTVVTSQKAPEELETPSRKQVETTKMENVTPKEAEFVPLFRGATADINTTLALALVAVTAIQYYGIANFGKYYISRFVSLKDPISFFLGILEVVSELSKVISFAFRLFGNIFAGEVLLTVMAFLMPFIAPLPFLTLELFVGFIQALVFSMLTAVFLNVAISHGEHEMHAHAHAGHASR